jgi:hypothetical protein
MGNTVSTTSSHLSSASDDLPRPRSDSRPIFELSDPNTLRKDAQDLNPSAQEDTNTNANADDPQPETFKNHYLRRFKIIFPNYEEL